MPKLGDTPVNDKLVDTQFSYNDIIPIYDVSEAKNKFTTFHELLHAWGFRGTAVVDALRAYKAKYAPRTANFDSSTETFTYSGGGITSNMVGKHYADKVPMDDQYFTNTDAGDITSVLTHNPDCWAARFDLSGVALHASGGDASRRGTLIGPKLITFSTHHRHDQNSRFAFTNSKGERFVYRIAQNADGSYKTAPDGITSSRLDLALSYMSVIPMGTHPDIGVAILEAADADENGSHFINSVDESITTYDLCDQQKHIGSDIRFTYILRTSSRTSSNRLRHPDTGILSNITADRHETPHTPRVTWGVLETGTNIYQGPRTQVSGSTPTQTSTGQVTFKDYYDGHPRFKDSSDPVFFVTDDNQLKLLGCTRTTTGEFTRLTSPYSGVVRAPLALDLFVSAWQTTRNPIS